MNRLTTIEKVKSMTEPTDSFLVGLEDNTYGIRFKGFKMRNVDNGEIFYEFITDNIYLLDYYASNELNYRFPNSILKARNIGSNLILVVGNNLVRDLTLIERHYINNNLVTV